MGFFDQSLHKKPPWDFREIKIRREFIDELSPEFSLAPEQSKRFSETFYIPQKDKEADDLYFKDFKVTPVVALRTDFGSRSPRHPIHGKIAGQKAELFLKFNKTESYEKKAAIREMHEHLDLALKSNSLILPDFDLDFHEDIGIVMRLNGRNMADPVPVFAAAINTLTRMQSERKSEDEHKETFWKGGGTGTDAIDTIGYLY